MLPVEVHSARPDFDGKPEVGADGLFVAQNLLACSVMARDAGWGTDIAEMLPNEDWNYAAFTPDRKPRPTDQAECLASHKPRDKSSFTYVLKELATAR